MNSSHQSTHLSNYTLHVSKIYKPGKGMKKGPKKSGKGKFVNVVETMSQQGRVKKQSFGQKGVMDELLANMKNGGAFQLKKRKKLKNPTLKKNQNPQNWLDQLKKTQQPLKK
eukprot:Anaeramoba_flamelloidesa569825_14.p1 GENE.a569825_14~~a569825_14.p1  ORF type:complete len:112 (+),score=28.13 a569825_14:3-338(+)